MIGPPVSIEVHGSIATALNQGVVIVNIDDVPVGPPPPEKPPPLKPIKAEMGAEELAYCAGTAEAFAGYTAQWDMVGEYLIGGWGNAIPTPKSMLGQLAAQLRPLKLEGALQALCGAVMGMADLGGKLQEAMTGCNSKEVASLTLLRAAVDLIERWTGLTSPEIRTRINLVRNVICPLLYPTQDGVDTAFRAAQIDLPQWLCWTKLNNNKTDPAWDVMYSGRTSPGVADCIRLWMRDFWSEKRRGEGMRRQGVMTAGEHAAFIELLKYIPGPSDIVRFMTRDVEDDAVVEKYEYDEDFEVKWAGELRRWSKAQGIDDTTMKRYWRAHWQLPSPTQGYEMLHRLRPGRAPSDTITTQETVDQLLGINDYPKYWRDRLIAISYNPLEKRDIQNAYYYGVIDYKEVIEAYMDRGSDRETATDRADISKAKYTEWLLARKPMRSWVGRKGAWELVTDELATLKVDESIAASVKQKLKVERKANLNYTCAKGIESRYMSGEIDQSQAHNALMELGMDFPDVADWMTEFECKKKARAKHLTVAQLCKFACDGVISWAEMGSRLIKLGWEGKDAAAIVVDCQLACLDKKQKVAAVKKAKEDAKHRRDQKEAAAKMDKAKKEKLKQDKIDKIKQRCVGRGGRWFGGDSKAETAFVEAKVCELHFLKGFSETAAFDWLCSVQQQAKDAGDKGWHRRADEMIQDLPQRGRGPVSPADRVTCPEPAANGVAAPLEPPIVR